MRKTRYYYGDFETTQPNENNEVQIYLWCMVGEGKVYHGTNMDEFINFLKTLNKSIIFFHNLKFDFSYIHYYLLSNDIECSVLEKAGTIYSVKFFDIELRDSMNFLNITLEDVGKNYCTKYHKTSIDYEVDYNHKATEEELEYCINDCMVLQEGLETYLNNVEDVLFNAGAKESMKKVHKKLTNAGIAFEAFKELSEFDKLCPKTTQNEYNLFRGAYKGGYVYSKPCGIVEDVQMIDANSMYPYMYSTIDMPYGFGKTCADEEDMMRFNWYICSIYARYELKPGYIPIIGGGVGKYGNITYKSSSEGEYEELVVCSTDLELIKRFYNIDYKWVWGVGFNTKKEFFKKYADTFIAVKNKEKGVKRNVAKVLLNSPYGKTAMNGLSEIRKYKVEDGAVVSEVVGYEVDDNVYQYLPIAIAITASARYYLLTTAEAIGFDNIYYMDTDSIKFKYKEVSFEYDPNTLGAWKDEGRCTLFKTIAPKKYVYWCEDTGVIQYTCAGFSKKVLSVEMCHNEAVDKDTAIKLMNIFEAGLELVCLQSKVVTGGRALIPTKKMMK